MTQQQNTGTNILIRDMGGHPQMYKLVPSTVKAVGGIVTAAGQPLKIIKAAAAAAGGQEQQQQQAVQQQQSYTTAVSSPAQVIRTIGSTPTKLVAKTVTFPVGTVTALQSAKGTKTFRLSSTTMQNIKVINTAHNNQTVTAAIPIVQQQQIVQNKYVSPPILDHSGSRKRQDPLDTEYAVESKRSRKTEKVGKGLRHFSMKVCEKVREKGTTSYNEVADELVSEFTNSPLNTSLADQQYDQKNIRRRVYDALNVLMAMNIISKEKKEIRWIGLPTNSMQECLQLQKEKQKRIESIRKKTKDLQCLIMNQVSFKNLAQRNMENEKVHGPPAPNSYIQLPFIVVNTNKKTIIDCSISNDKMEYMFQFNDKFEINDDQEVLKSIGMLMGLDSGDVTAEDLKKLKRLVPKVFEEFVEQLASGTSDHLTDLLESAGAGPSNMSTMFTAEDIVETQLDEDNSRQSSSCDPLSPGAPEFTDEEVDSDEMSSDELN